MRQGMGKGSEGCAKGGERRKGERLRCGEEKDPPPPNLSQMFVKNLLTHSQSNPTRDLERSFPQEPFCGCRSPDN